MSRVDPDPERGRAVAAELKALGVKKRELIRAAEQGYITELACKMPAAVDNAILAHRLCNRIDHSLRVGRSHERDLERIRKAREEAIRRTNVQIGNTAEPEAEAATPETKQTKKAPEWKSLPGAEKAQYLLDHQTISDRTWTEESRLKDEKRDAFIHRILGFPKTP